MDLAPISSVSALAVTWTDSVWTQRSAYVRIAAADGTLGLGEASPMAGGDAALALVPHLAPHVLGACALDRGRLHDRIGRALQKVGAEGPLAAALGALDLALVDLAGRQLGLPAHRLLGGAWRDSLPFYASVGNTAGLDPEALCTRIEPWLPLRPGLIKIRCDRRDLHLDADIPGDIARAGRLRRLVGDGVELAFDGNNGYTPAGALRLGRALEGFGYRWFEEPLVHGDRAGLGRLAAALDLAIAAGEQEYTVAGLAALAEAGVDILQPDLVKAGGFTRLQRMAAVADLAGLPLIPHQTMPQVGTAANLHFLACRPQEQPAELNGLHPGRAAAFPGLRPPAAGRIALPEGPGLGLDFAPERVGAEVAVRWASA